MLDQFTHQVIDIVTLMTMVTTMTMTTPLQEVVVNGVKKPLLIDHLVVGVVPAVILIMDMEDQVVKVS